MSEQPNEPAFEVLTPQEVADLKDAWMNGRGLTKLPPVGNLILRMISTVERARAAFGLANRKWDECRVTIDQLEARLAAAEEVIDWYGKEFLYDMPKFVTSIPGPTDDLSELPGQRLVEIMTNPVAHDRGKRARAWQAAKG